MRANYKCAMKHRISAAQTPLARCTRTTFGEACRARTPQNQSNRCECEAHGCTRQTLAKGPREKEQNEREKFHTYSTMRIHIFTRTFVGASLQILISRRLPRILPKNLHFYFDFTQIVRQTNEFRTKTTKMHGQRRRYAIRMCYKSEQTKKKLQNALAAETANYGISAAIIAAQRCGYTGHTMCNMIADERLGRTIVCVRMRNYKEPNRSAVYVALYVG